MGVRWIERIDRAIYGVTGELIEYQTIARDITDKKNIQLSLEENEEKFRNLAETIPALIWIFNQDNEITYANKNSASFFGSSDLELLNNTWKAHLYPEDKTILEVLDQSIFNRTTLEQDVRIRNLENNSYRWFLMKGVPLTLENNYRGYIIACVDITQKKKAMLQMEKAKVQMVKAIKLREEFVANISHEIRTPLNTIVGFANLLESTKLNVKQTEYVDAIQLSTDNLLVIIDDILDFSKINAGKIKLVPETIIIDKFVDDLLKSVKFKAEGKLLKINFRITDKVTDRIYGDPHRLSQILLNLIDNAIKFTDKGHIDIEIDSINTDKDREVLKFIIKDTGIGIPKEKIGTIFESFTQASYDISKDYGGTGLGLSITKKLVDLLEGKITVESVVGVGSVFEVTIPFEKNRKLEEKVEHQTKSEEDSFRDLKVLVVEDNKMNQLVLSKLLENKSALITIANNGLEAVNILKDKNFDLILMDIRMDTMDGYEATEYIRANLSKTVPIIGISANAESEEVNKVKKIGMNDYISKPFRPENLYKIILKYINKYE